LLLSYSFSHRILPLYSPVIQRMLMFIFVATFFLDFFSPKNFLGYWPLSSHLFPTHAPRPLHPHTNTQPTTHKYLYKYIYWEEGELNVKLTLYKELGNTLFKKNIMIDMIDRYDMICVCDILIYL
jgi:hypothetical protein